MASMHKNVHIIEEKVKQKRLKKKKDDKRRKRNGILKANYHSAIDFWHTIVKLISIDRINTTHQLWKAIDEVTPKVD